MGGTQVGCIRVPLLLPLRVASAGRSPHPRPPTLRRLDPAPHPCPCPRPPQEEERTLQRELDAAQRRVHEALCDNVNTTGALGALCDLVKAANIYLAARDGGGAEGGKPGPQPLLLRAAAAYVTRILSVFGLAPAPGDFLGFAEPGLAGAEDEALHAMLDGFTAFRCGQQPGSRAEWLGTAAACARGATAAAAPSLHGLRSRCCRPLLTARSARRLCSDVARGLAKAKAPATELAAACAGAPGEAAAKAGAGGGRPQQVLAAFQAFRDEVAALAAARAPPGDVLAACDRCAPPLLLGRGTAAGPQAGVCWACWLLRVAHLSPLPAPPRPCSPRRIARPALAQRARRHAG